MHTTQAVIARLESGRMKPSTRTLERLAAATGMRLRISFEPASLAPRRAATLPLIILPIIWCLASALTLRTIGASEGWIPLTAAALAVLAQAWPRRNGTGSNSDAAPDDQRRPVRGSAVVGRSGVPGVHAPCRQ